MESLGDASKRLLSFSVRMVTVLLMVEAATGSLLGQAAVTTGVRRIKTAEKNFGGEDKDVHMSC